MELVLVSSKRHKPTS